MHSNFRCICRTDYWGLDCNQDACPKNCNGRGTCLAKTATLPNRCECLPDYSGPDCGQYAAANSTQPPAPTATPASLSMIITSSGLTQQQVLSQYDAGYTCSNNCSGHGYCVKEIGAQGSIRGRCECARGFAGHDCSGECTLYCNGRGKCTGADPLSVQCECEEGYKGVGCIETYCARNCSAPNGVCITEGTTYPYCQCSKRAVGTSEFTGPACAIDPNCNGAGVFKFGKCICDPGAGGVNCDQKVTCTDNCNGRGKCRGSQPSDETKAIGTCECDDGWTGPTCSQPRCPKDCSNRGVCTTSSQALVCSCYPGWMGTSCDTQVKCPNNCTAAHRGTCIPKGDNTNDGFCKCSEGWSGPACADIGCEANCNNHGTCIEGKCAFCEDGYSGRNCEIACPEKCNGRGTCLGGVCKCQPGYAGMSCAEASVCPGNGTEAGECGSKAQPSRGVCDKPKGQCFCSPGFAGEACEKEDTCGLGCGPYGSCRNGRCYCDPGWQGPRCESQSACENNCNNRGLCANGRCFCNTGFNGTSCEQFATDNTCPKNCSGNGVCQYGRCHCLDGHSGNDCGTFSGNPRDVVTSPCSLA